MVSILEHGMVLDVGKKKMSKSLGNIISPQEGGSYGYNTSLPLNFSVADEHLDSCWYNINNGNNKRADPYGRTRKQVQGYWV